MALKSTSKEHAVAAYAAAFNLLLKKMWGGKINYDYINDFRATYGNLLFGENEHASFICWLPYGQWSSESIRMAKEWVVWEGIEYKVKINIKEAEIQEIFDEFSKVLWYIAQKDKFNVDSLGHYLQ